MGLSAYGTPELFESLRPRLRLRRDGGFSFLPLNNFRAAMARYAPRREPRRRSASVTWTSPRQGQSILELPRSSATPGARRSSWARPEQARVCGRSGAEQRRQRAGRSEVRPGSVYVAPNAGDPGHSLGCALFGAYEIASWGPPAGELPSISARPTRKTRSRARSPRALTPGVRPDPLAETLSACIANGHIVGRFDGGSEFGPRALGNRSILADPRRPGMKDFLNLRVKHRESFRPFAPTVLEDQAGEWFELEAAERVHAPGRADPTRPARADTRRRSRRRHGEGSDALGAGEPGFWSLISAFRDRTGVPLVLNTSFNLAGKPIVETPADAVSCFATSLIDVLAVGPFVVSKQPLESYLDTDSGAPIRRPRGPGRRFGHARATPSPTRARSPRPQIRASSHQPPALAVDDERGFESGIRRQLGQPPAWAPRLRSDARNAVGAPRSTDTETSPAASRAPVPDALR